ncbi:RdgB/HAM1 family non-canonical purine NTP pyrophosphatase [Pedobacter duraquae]|uniref:dITP/XTP pyrophosphatase n=1 Tax=Pedobacter duraquae TaxID=425511 RepID=A0A4R6IIB4_9SPHI|nr:RdgB/HAM1 family non-canonical purine NTP pyrophosphatase [Pedobacter duraquae]TDO21700.1 XTP/dITP diphosphohydrolase [Pedobacter duraquae]
MMPELVFATHNAHKTAEVALMLKAQFTILNLDDLGCHAEIPEIGLTFAENAAIKSAYVWENYQIDCFADDSGLEVDALNMEPGIYSARYSGAGDVANYQLVLSKMEGVLNRKARFRTVICLLLKGQEFFFEGALEGTIRPKPSGNQGFGYDPIFQPDGYTVTLAEMDMQEKNSISHRALAMQKLLHFLSIAD